MTRPTKAGDRGKNPLPRNQPDDKTVRCAATEGAQQCLSATHHHLQNHRWGPRGETDQWNQDGSPKIPDPAADTLVEELPPDPHAPDPQQARDLEEMEQHRQQVRDRLAEPWPDAFNGDNKPEPQTVTADQAREALANEAPSGPLLADVRDQARAQGIARRGPAETDAADQAVGVTHPDVQRPTARADASDSLLAAAMGVLVPAAHQDFAITHAEESARVAVMVQTVGRMIRTIADGQLTDATDLRTVYLKVRQIAATHGIDLDAQDGGS